MKKRRLEYPPWLTVEEAADLLRLHKSTVYEYCREGVIPHLKIGQRTMIDRDGLFWAARGWKEKIKKEEAIY